ncbi:polysaccharide biosynthesis/export family protein [Calothrix sp. PCC 6303]|uniref:polysaccharide biosynthesis/export family protein n=2 Tax=Calothrix sp. PCC 6303 TaxID=1170562 RepID=UPI0002A011DF|nr:polysaccharide export protein [Calothrix sp. PCC 6303]
MLTTVFFKMRLFNALCTTGLYLSVFTGILHQSVVAQAPPTQEKLPDQAPSSTIIPSQQPPSLPPDSSELSPSNISGAVSPQFGRYLLGPGDVINLSIQRPPGEYRLGPGDSVSVFVQRFPDLGFQAQINPEGNITAPLLGTIRLQNLTLAEAQQKIRNALNRYVVEPTVVVSLSTLRPDTSFQTLVDPEGNIAVPQIGTVSVQGLTLQEAQEKIRLQLRNILVQPIVTASLASPRQVQITISGEVFKPGIYSLNPSTPRINDALLLAGGSTVMADLRQIQVRRRLLDGTLMTQNIDLYAALQNGGSVPNLRLQDGDAVVLTRREVGNDDSYDRTLVARSSLATPVIKVRVLNYVAGGIVVQSLPNGSSFVDVLAGVSVANSNLQDIALIRFDPERGRAVTLRLNARKALSGDISQNVPLQDNDVIVVGRNLLGKITGLLTTVTRPFYDVRTFLNFFDTLGGSDSNQNR